MLKNKNYFIKDRNMENKEKTIGIKKNFILNTLYQIVLLITPFITAPYISRVLESSGVGIYSYTYSIEMYFSLFAALGTGSYGLREIARNRNDKYKRSQLFWEIELLTVITTAVSLVFWGVWILFNDTYKVYYIILTLYLLATMFDISWFYTGLEQFKHIVLSNTIFRLLGIVALFLFVKTKTDVGIYTLIMSLTVLGGNLSMWIYLPKYITKVKIHELRIRPHFKESLIYFIPTISTSVYTVLDKTLIGAITHNESENGYYEQATKIINMAKTVTFVSLNNILGSRISYLFAEERYDEIRCRIRQSIDYIAFMGIGICFGLSGVASRFVPIFFGQGYDKVVILLQMLSPIIVIIGISNCIGSQYYSPIGLRALSAKFLIVGACVNLVLNLVLIPKFWGYGAVVASVIAETVIAVLYVKFCDRYVTAEIIAKKLWKKVIAGLGMFGVIMLIDKIITSNIVALIAECAAGFVVYLLILCVLRDGFIKDFVIDKIIHGMLGKLRQRKCRG